MTNRDLLDCEEVAQLRARIAELERLGDRLCYELSRAADQVDEHLIDTWRAYRGGAK